MTFPVVAELKATAGADTNPNSCPVDMPDTVNADDLLLMHFVCEYSTGINVATPSGWTRKGSENYSTFLQHILFAKKAAGTEGGGSVTVTQTNGSGSNYSAHVYRITGHNDVAGVEISTTKTLASNIYPASLTPTWGAADTLWVLAVASADDNGYTTAASTNYTANLTDTSAPQGVNDSARMASSYRTVNAAVEDPTSWTLSETEAIVSILVAVQPGALGGGGGVTLIGKSFDARWDMLNSAGKSADLQWSIVNAVQQSTDLQWGILNAAGKSADLRHSIIEAVGKSSDLRWDILGALASVGKSLDAQWATLNATGNNIDLRWDALTTTGKDVDAQWDILATASKDLDARWSILNAIFKDADLRYDVLSAVVKDIDLRWDVLSSITTVGTSLDLQWSILATVGRSLDSRWGLLGSVGKDADMRWGILKAVSSSADLQWAILQSAGKQVDIQWSQLATTGKDIALQWRVLSDSSFPDITGTVTINSATKQITLSSKTPIITIH